MRLCGRKNGKRTAWIAALIAGAAAAIACGDPDPQEDAGYARPVEPVASSVAASTVDDGSRGDGVHEVGATITAGKWTTTAPGGGYGCYWSRKKDASGEVGSIIANGFVPKGAPGITQIQPSDKFVEFSGGCRWVKAG